MSAMHEVNIMDDQRAADAIGIESIPGTEIMRDIDGVRLAHAKGSHGAVYVSATYTVVTTTS